jgi:hypothetical protein
VLFDTKCDDYFGEYSKPKLKKKQSILFKIAFPKFQNVIDCLDIFMETCGRLVMITSIQK